MSNGPRAKLPPPSLPHDSRMSHLEGDLRAAPGARFAILAARWNPRITDALVAGARKAFEDNGVSADAVDVVRGDTRHYEHVADRCAEGLMRVAIDFRVPVLNGVLAAERFEDAEARAGGSHGNKGEEAAMAAIEMHNLLEKLP